MPDFDDNKGTSLVMVNSEKGHRAYESVQDRLTVRDIDVKSVLQPQMQYPNSRPIKRDVFWKDYREKGIAYVSKKYRLSDRGLWGCVKKVLRPVKRWIVGQE